MIRLISKMLKTINFGKESIESQRPNILNQRVGTMLQVRGQTRSYLGYLPSFLAKVAPLAKPLITSQLMLQTLQRKYITQSQISLCSNPASNYQTRQASRHDFSFLMSHSLFYHDSTEIGCKHVRHRSNGHLYHVIYMRFCHWIGSPTTICQHPVAKESRSVYY